MERYIVTVKSEILSTYMIEAKDEDKAKKKVLVGDYVYHESFLEGEDVSRKIEKIKKWNQ